MNTRLILAILLTGLFWPMSAGALPPQGDAGELAACAPLLLPRDFGAPAATRRLSPDPELLSAIVNLNRVQLDFLREHLERLATELAPQEAHLWYFQYLLVVDLHQRTVGDLLITRTHTAWVAEYLRALCDRRFPLPAVPPPPWSPNLAAP